MPTSSCSAAALLVVASMLAGPRSADAAAAAAAPPRSRAGRDPAVDCRRAAAPIETLVCRSAALRALDRRLADTDRAALAKTYGEARTALRITQRHWVETRNACATSVDRGACTQAAYQTRIAELQARHALVPAFRSVPFDCSGPAPSTIVATFYNGEPLPSVRLLRGADVAIGVLARSGSGARYVGAHGIEFWNKGDNAQVEWPEGTRFACSARR